MINKLQITKVMDGEEDMGDKGASGALETNNREAMPAMPRISIRSDLFNENRNAKLEGGEQAAEDVADERQKKLVA